MKLYKQTVFPILVILYLFISEILSLHINFFRYADEIVTVIMTLYLIKSILLKKICLSKYLKNILYMCVILCIIGLFSNFISQLQNSLYVIALDIVSCMKLFICSLAFSNFLNQKKAKAIIEFLNKPAKIMLLLGITFLLISQFVDLGMRGSQRFGIWSFKFIFGYEHVYSIATLFLLLIVYSSEKNKNKTFYLIIAIVQMISTTKGPSIIWAISVLFLIIYMKKKNKINISVFIILGIFCLLLGSYQISNYFMNSDAPRFLFYKYGAVTANEYFPFGSGFSTFGSDMAAENYSKLYIEYGFNGLYGMSMNDKSFLNDNYWPMIYAQFGWIGLVVYLIIVYNTFIILQKIRIKGMKKGILFSVFFYTIIHSIGSALLTSSASIIIYIGIVLFIKSNVLEEENVSE